MFYFNALYFCNVINQLTFNTFRIITYEDISIAKTSFLKI